MNSSEHADVVTRVVFTPKVVGERDGFTRRTYFYGSLEAAEYNGAGEQTCVSIGRSVSADTERICKMLLLAKVKKEVDVVLNLVQPLTHEVRPIKVSGLCAQANRA